MRASRLYTIGSIALVLIAVAAPATSGEERALPLAELTHIHGIEFEVGGSAILLATHHGVYRYQSGAQAVLHSVDSFDYMGFAKLADGTFIASGHPETGGNLGVLKSSDSGAQWTKISDGVDGPVDFHAIASAGNNADILFGLYQGRIQSSTDGGESWLWSGNAPIQTIDLASSPDGATLFAATATGVRFSTDKGRSWAMLPGDLPLPTTMVSVFGGILHAYVMGHGFVRRPLADAGWETVAPDMGSTVLLHLAQDPQDNQRFVAVSQDSDVLESKNTGSSWLPLE